LSLSLQHTSLHRHEYLSRIDTAALSRQAVEKIFRYGAPVGTVIEQHARLDRCMDRLQELMVESEDRGEVPACGTIVLADSLRCSSGRFDRCWHAPVGGLWMAMAWPDTLVPEFSRMLPFAAGLACCRVVRSFQLDARLKWVNDVLVDDKKIAGILCETVLRPNGDRYHLLGIGLNVNNQAFPEDLLLHAAGMAGLLGHDLDSAEVFGRLLAELTWAVGLLYYDEELSLREQLSCEEGRVPLLLDCWQQLSNTVGRRVMYGFDVWKNPLYRAVVTGFTPCGGLIMQLDDGSGITEYSGEIRYIS
jgi:BirA family biotin operon repressor/biotin-[acetyl-CoA-carboxylase] ligase